MVFGLLPEKPAVRRTYPYRKLRKNSPPPCGHATAAEESLCLNLTVSNEFQCHEKNSNSFPNFFLIWLNGASFKLKLRCAYKLILSKHITLPRQEITYFDCQSLSEAHSRADFHPGKEVVPGRGSAAP